MTRMVTTLRASLATRGLTLHASKCKAQTNRGNWRRRGLVTIQEGLALDIIPEGESLMVLGTSLSLSDPSGCEIENRTGSAWRLFWGMSRLLLNRKCSLNKRLKLFSNTVTNCALWCAESWTPRQEELRELQSTERAMLRRIVGATRGADESWLDWLQRSTRKALDLASRMGLSEWGLLRYKKKWLWAGKVARQRGESWLHKVTFWRDSEWQRVVSTLPSRPMRPSRRRWMKFEDCLRRFSDECGGLPWKEAALDEAHWQKSTELFGRWNLR